MPRKLLSSKLTFVYKVVFPVLFVVSVIWGLGVWIFGRGVWARDVSINFFIIALIITAINLLWIGWLALRSCRVEVDDENFYVSNFGKEAIIPRADL